MALSLRLSEDETNLLKNYAKLQDTTVSELIRSIVFEKIEDELDLKAYNTAIKAYEEDNTTFTLDEVEKELGF